MQIVVYLFILFFIIIIAFFVVVGMNTSLGSFLGPGKCNKFCAQMSSLTSS